MTHTLTAKEQSLAKIFSDDYVFTIPGYQRPYAWGCDQAQELLDDLLDALASAPEQLSDMAPYFLGSIVLIKAEAVPEATVVDGQQRLSTLTLLLSAIRATVGDAELQKDITSCIYEKGSLVKGTLARYRLSLRERDRDFFRQYVQHENGLQALVQLNTVLPDAQARLRANARVLMDGLAKLEQPELVRLVQFVITRCYLVTVATPDLDSAYRIFGVLNSRGLDLSATDILKAEIIGGIEPGLRDTYTKKWEDDTVLFELESARHGLAAAAKEQGGAFTVLAGSQARLDWSGQPHSYQQLRNDLRNTDVLKLSDDSMHLIFTADTPFQSPSAASATILGRTDNGRSS